MVATVMLVIGVALTVLAATTALDSMIFLKKLAENVGGVLLATGLISILWELISKRAFLSEVFAIARLSEDIKTSGLLRVTTNFQHEIEWPELLTSAKRIDIFVSYARTWRNTNLALLRAFAERQGSVMNLILPDPDDPKVLGELARRYNLKPETIGERISEAIQEFQSMFDRKRSGRGQLSIWVTGTVPIFTFYRVDGRIVIAMYRHRLERGDIPTFICDNKGQLAQFIDKEFNALTDETVRGVRKIFPPDKNVDDHVPGPTPVGDQAGKA